ncbi:MAG: 4Fe-4S binding protein [Acidobacteria bacterium]|nr:4Fe-4S binding protein [Acidobacteriota bacterium]MBK8812022.1 4Fe-4S binding protein [Acidobacteriota bacterium]
MLVDTEAPKVRKKLPVVNKNFQLEKYNWHRVRRIVHLLCFLVFVSLPFFNVMRFDIPRQRFYIFGNELWINEFGIIFFSMLFLMFVVAAISMLYGRVYCGYLCPQMIFSEASINLEERVRTFINKHFAKRSQNVRAWMGRIAVYTVLGLGSVFLAFVFIAYFVEPRDLFGRLISLDLVTAGGFAGAVVTLITFADFAFLRQKFCTTVCPYGYLQGILGDNHTLVVQYRDPEQICVECKKCVRVCHMGIDIRDSPYQIECIHCGECVDACKLIMGKFGKDTLIHYAWGEKGELLGDKKMKWYQRIGVRDIKRVAVFAIILIYGASLAVALSMRHNVLVQIAPNRATLYRLGDDGRVFNTFRMTLANRGTEDATITLSMNLPEARFELEAPEFTLKAGEELKREFEISVPAKGLPQEINHFEIRSNARPDATEDVFEQTFVMPVERK